MTYNVFGGTLNLGQLNLEIMVRIRVRLRVALF